MEKVTEYEEAPLRHMVMTFLSLTRIWLKIFPIEITSTGVIHKVNKLFPNDIINWSNMVWKVSKLLWIKLRHMQSISLINFVAKKYDPLLNIPYDVQLRCLSANFSNMSKFPFCINVSYSVSFISKLFTLSTASTTTVLSPCKDFRIFRCVNMSTGI